MNAHDIAGMVAAYAECALWSSTNYTGPDDDGTPFDEDYDVGDIAAETLAEMTADCLAFYDECADDLAGMAAEQAGQDFWLTRNRHGAGFWDRGLGPVGDRLTAACRPYGSVDLYVGDDGKVWAS
jgi:hypothetical protein